MQITFKTKINPLCKKELSLIFQNLREFQVAVLISNLLRLLRKVRPQILPKIARSTRLSRNLTQDSQHNKTINNNNELVLTIKLPNRNKLLSRKLIRTNKLQILRILG